MCLTPYCLLARPPLTAAITSGPSGITAEDTIKFEFGTESGSGAGIRFQCKLADSKGNLTAPAHKDWEECTSPASFADLPDGSYQFAVRAGVSRVAATNSHGCPATAAAACNGLFKLQLLTPTWHVLRCLAHCRERTLPAAATL
jgi:hypothetical protein